nr:hypothetical protein [Blastococcus sp. Marseille-P5729]
MGAGITVGGSAGQVVQQGVDRASGGRRQRAEQAHHPVVGRLAELDVPAGVPLLALRLGLSRGIELLQGGVDPLVYHADRGAVPAQPGDPRGERCAADHPVEIGAVVVRHGERGVRDELRVPPAQLTGLQPSQREGQVTRQCDGPRDQASRGPGGHAQHRPELGGGDLGPGHDPIARSVGVPDHVAGGDLAVGEGLLRAGVCLPDQPHLAGLRRGDECLDRVDAGDRRREPLSAVQAGGELEQAVCEPRELALRRVAGLEPGEPDGGVATAGVRAALVLDQAHAAQSTDGSRLSRCWRVRVWTTQPLFTGLGPST